MLIYIVYKQILIWRYHGDEETRLAVIRTNVPFSLEGDVAASLECLATC